MCGRGRTSKDSAPNRKANLGVEWMGGQGRRIGRMEEGGGREWFYKLNAKKEKKSFAWPKELGLICDVQRMRCQGRGKKREDRPGGLNSRYQVWHIWNSASGVGCLNNWPREVINSHDLTGYKWAGGKGMGGLEVEGMVCGFPNTCNSVRDEALSFFFPHPPYALSQLNSAIRTCMDRNVQCSSVY